MSSFPGVQKPVDQYGSSVAEGAVNGDTAAADDEDDFDLFGSDDDDDIVCIYMYGVVGGAGDSVVGGARVALSFSRHFLVIVLVNLALLCVITSIRKHVSS